jgi:hypothetical protein
MAGASAACGVLVYDLGQLGISGLATAIYRPASAGGLAVLHPTAFVMDKLVPMESAGAVAWAGALAGYLLAMLGVAVVPATLAGVLFHAQLGHLLPPSDRGIDQVLRVVLTVLAAGGAPSMRRRPSLDGLSGRLWPADLVRFQLVLMYLGAGWAKVLRDRDWLFWSDEPPLSTILADPLVGNLDPMLAARLAPAMYVLGVATILLEVSAFLLLTRWRRHWALVAAVMHVGIALTLDIGAFSAGLLALFPLLLMQEDAVVVLR